MVNILIFIYWSWFHLSKQKSLKYPRRLNNFIETLDFLCNFDNCSGNKSIFWAPLGLLWNEFDKSELSVYCFVFIMQVLVRQSCPKRNVRRGEKSWRQSERSGKRPKVLWSWEHASWTDVGWRKEHGLQAPYKLNVHTPRDRAAGKTVNVILWQGSLFWLMKIKAQTGNPWSKAKRLFNLFFFYQPNWLLYSNCIYPFPPVLMK